MSVQVNFAHQKHNWIHATAHYQHNTGMWDTQQIISPVSARHFIQQCFWWHTVYMYLDMYMHARITYTALVKTLNHSQSINVQYMHNNAVSGVLQLRTLSPLLHAADNRPLATSWQQPTMQQFLCYFISFYILNKHKTPQCIKWNMTQPKVNHKAMCWPNTAHVCM